MISIIANNKVLVI